jgi:hypothetical protein
MARTASRSSRSRAPWWTGKKRMVPPKNWQSAPAGFPGLKAKGQNAVCIRPGYADGAACCLVVVDAGGEDAIEVVERLVAETCAGIQVPRVKTQRGATGRHYYFRATEKWTKWTSLL